MKVSGLVLVAAAFIGLAALFFPLLDRYPNGAIISQAMGASALVAMALVQILATRFPPLESIFGGLDRQYVLHKWLAIYALVAVLMHENIGAEIKALGENTGLAELAEDVGEVALNGLMALVFVSIATFIPYPIWKLSHKFMGLFFALGAFHYAFIKKPFANSDLVGMYVLAFCMAGLLAYIWTLLPKLRWTHAAYQVTDIQHTGGAVAFSLTPTGRGIRHYAGQFAFLKFDHDLRHAPWSRLPWIQNFAAREAHPFTISQAPQSDRSLRFTIKPLGDYTTNLKGHVTPGAQARVSLAYGHFLRPNPKQPQVWIAGGVGVTPFIAWADSVHDGQAPVHMFACAQNRASIPHLAELEAVAAQHSNFHLHVIVSDSSERLTADKVLALVDQPVQKLHVAFCGPTAMRKEFQRDLVAKGIKRRHFHFEAFELRSGIGLGWLLRKATSWIAARLSSRSAVS